MFKVVVTVPETHGNKLRSAIGNAGGGKIGNYSHCSFTTKGTGRFLPQDGARPAIGRVGVPQEVLEERIEFLCNENSLKRVLRVIRDNHPYEEPSIDVYPLLAQ